MLMRLIRAGFYLLTLTLAGTAWAVETGTPNLAQPPNPSTAAAVKPQGPRVIMETSLGNVTIELFPDQAPISVANFLQYVDAGFYNGVIFHRVVAGFVVQVGGYDDKFKKKQLRPPIKNESNNGLLNLRGTLSMARTMSPDSATSQFFINLVDNPALDNQDGNPGYAVFGKVVEGMDVVDRMTNMPQGRHTGAFMNAPNDPILIKKAYRAGKKPIPSQKSKP